MWHTFCMHSLVSPALNIIRKPWLQDAGPIRDYILKAVSASTGSIHLLAPVVPLRDYMLMDGVEFQVRADSPFRGHDEKQINV